MEGSQRLTVDKNRGNQVVLEYRIKINSEWVRGRKRFNTRLSRFYESEIVNDAMLKDIPVEDRLKISKIRNASDTIIKELLEVKKQEKPTLKKGEIMEFALEFFHGKDYKVKLSRDTSIRAIKNLCEFMGSKGLSPSFENCTPQIVTAYMNDRISGVSKSTARNEYYAIESTINTYAYVSDSDLNVGVFKVAKQFINWDNSLPKKRTKTLEIWQIIEMLAYMKDYPKVYKIILTMLITGIDHSELFKLTGDQIMSDQFGYYINGSRNKTSVEIHKRLPERMRLAVPELFRNMRSEELIFPKADYPYDKRKTLDRISKSMKLSYDLRVKQIRNTGSTIIPFFITEQNQAFESLIGEMYLGHAGDSTRKMYYIDINQYKRVYAQMVSEMAKKFIF